MLLALVAILTVVNCGCCEKEEGPTDDQEGDKNKNETDLKDGKNLKEIANPKLKGKEHKPTLSAKKETSTKGTEESEKPTEVKPAPETEKKTEGDKKADAEVEPSKTAPVKA